MIKKMLGMVSLAFAVVFAQARIQTAEDLLLNIDVSSLSLLSDGEKVDSWSNTGTLGGDFHPALEGQGAIYETDVLGVAAVSFNRTASTVMTSDITPPASILSNHTWSVELWVLNPSLEFYEDQLAWTDRGAWSGLPDGQCMEFRYSSDANNCVEHYDGVFNIPWNGLPPQAGIWHHLAVTRAADGTERLYADGVLRTVKKVAINLRAGSTFKLGGVRDIGASSWSMFFSGSLAKARVHDGTLSGAQVENNYLYERDDFQNIWKGSGTLDWNDPSNWVNGNVATNGDSAWIDNGGTAVLTNDLEILSLYPHHGGLTINNGATCSIAAADSTYMGLGNGSRFDLTVNRGTFAVVGSSNRDLFLGVNGGRAELTIGGATTPAVLDVDRFILAADGDGSVANITLADKGVITTAYGSFYLARKIGAVGSLNISGGRIGSSRAGNAFVVNADGACGAVTLNGGIIEPTADVIWSHGTVTNTACGTVYLNNGGTIHARRLYAANTSGTNLLYLNGGVVRARESLSDFMYGLTTAYVQSGGAVFDIPAGVDVTAAQGLVEEPTNLGGGLTKNGAGALALSGVNAFTGAISVQGGALHFISANGLPAAYSGAISVLNNSSIGYAKVGGAAELLANLNTASVGYLTLFEINSDDAVDFSAFPYMRLALDGLTAYTGDYIPFQGQYKYLVDGSIVTNAAVLTDAGVAGHLSISGVNGGEMILMGASTFTGGVEIDGAAVSMAHASAFGVQALAGVADVELRNGAILRLTAAMDVNAFVTKRLKASSDGILLLSAANADQNVDLSALPGIVLGSAELNLDYSGTITPFGTAYRLGGGTTVYASPNRGLSVSNLTDQSGATEVVIGTPGMVELKAGNSYSGGTVVTNGGILFMKEDGLGAIPAAPDSDNLFVDGGVVRVGQAEFTLNENRGLTVGADGMIMHLWSNSNMTLDGNLCGSGDISVSDTGFVTFAGVANTYAGTLRINIGGNVRFDEKANFNWETMEIVDHGSLWLKTEGASSFGGSVSGNGALRKEGAGTLTVDAPQNYSGITYVDAGALRFSDVNLIASSVGIEIAGGAQLDANGLNLAVGTLRGEGDVMDSSGAATSFTVGTNNANSVFAGNVAESLLLTKVGTGTQSLTASNSAAAAHVREGTLELLNGGSITGALSIAAGGTLSVSFDESGLTGEFYKLSATPEPSQFTSLAVINAFLDGKTPNLVVSSLELGEYLDLGKTGSSINNFPEGYADNGHNNFVAYYSGLFFAETTGVYGFATVSDDGSMVFVNGETVLDNNAYQSYTISDTNIVGEVCLTKGYHEFIVMMYEASGDQGLTVYMTPPGGAQTKLPNVLLSSSDNIGQDSSIGSLSGSAGSVLHFGEFGEVALRVTDDGDMCFDGDIITENEASRLIKEGAGQLTLTSGTSDQAGVLDVRAGSLFLSGGCAILGALEMASDATTKVTGFNGLAMDFYNRSSSDSDYSVMQSLDAWENYLAASFPDGPSYTANSLMLGANLDTGATGTKWPTDYIQEQGVHSDNYDVFIYGSIYLDRSGTYTFGTQSDDGSMLYIDRQLVVRNGYNQGFSGSDRYGTIVLSAGLHEIAIPYRENTGGNALRVFIGYPDEGVQMIPQSIFFGGTVLRALAGDSGSALDLGADGIVLLEQNVDAVHAGTITGNMSAYIKKDGRGTLTLTDDNSGYDGGYGVVAGTLQVGDGGETGALGATAYAVVDADGTLAFDRAGSVTVGGSLTGNGLIQVNGIGEVYLAASGSFDGLVEVNNGRLTFAPGVDLGSGATITNLTVVEAETSGTTTFFDTLAGDGDFEITGAGTLKVVSDNVAFEGATRIDTDATLLLTQPSQLGGGGDVTLNGGTLAIKPAVARGTEQLLPPLSDTNWSVNGSATWVTRNDSRWVELTPNEKGRAASVFCDTTINPALPWYATFRYEVGDTSAPPADGMAFVVQNDTDGVAAIGASGGDIGVNTISPSIGFYFDIYQGDSIGWIVDGGKVDDNTAIEGIDLISGVDVECYYDGAKLVLRVTQGAKVYTAERSVDLHAKFGGGAAWAGMTAGTGGATAQQFVGEFAMIEAESTSTEFGNTLVVEGDKSGSCALFLLSDETVVHFAGMNLGSASTLNIAPVAFSQTDVDYTVAVSNLSVAVGNGTVSMAANGTGVGVLGLENLSIGSGALLTVSGAVSAPSGSLTVTVPTPVMEGVTLLGDFTEAVWAGARPELCLVDANGDPVDAVLKLRNGKLYINTAVGTLMILR